MIQKKSKFYRIDQVFDEIRLRVEETHKESKVLLKDQALIGVLLEEAISRRMT